MKFKLGFLTTPTCRVDSRAPSPLRMDTPPLTSKNHHAKKLGGHPWSEGGSVTERGAPKSETGKLGLWVSNKYDGAGRIWAKDLPNGKSNSYDLRGAASQGTGRLGGGSRDNTTLVSYKPLHECDYHSDIEGPTTKGRETPPRIRAFSTSSSSSASTNSSTHSNHSIAASSRPRFDCSGPSSLEETTLPCSPRRPGGYDARVNSLSNRVNGYNSRTNSLNSRTSSLNSNVSWGSKTSSSSSSSGESRADRNLFARGNLFSSSFTFGNGGRRSSPTFSGPNTPPSSCSPCPSSPPASSGSHSATDDTGGREAAEARGVSGINVVVLGDNGVGKSAITVRYLTRRYIGEYSSSNDLMYQHNTTVDHSPIHLRLLDAAAAQPSHKLKQHQRWADAFVVVYDVTKRASFCHAREVLSALNSQTDARAPCRSSHTNYVEKYFKRDTYMDDTNSQALTFATESRPRRCSIPFQSSIPSQCSSLSLCSMPLHYSRLSQYSSRSHISTPSRCSSPLRCSGSYRCSSPSMCSISPRCSSPSQTDSHGRESPSPVQSSPSSNIKHLFLPPFSRGLEREHDLAREVEDHKGYLYHRSISCPSQGANRDGHASTGDGSSSHRQVHLQNQCCHSDINDTAAGSGASCFYNGEMGKANGDCMSHGCEKEDRDSRSPACESSSRTDAPYTDRDVYNPDHPDPCTRCACIRDREHCCSCDPGTLMHLEKQPFQQFPFDGTRLESHVPDLVQTANRGLLEDVAEAADQGLSPDQINCGGNTPPRLPLTSHAPQPDCPVWSDATGNARLTAAGSLRAPPQSLGVSSVSSNTLDSCQLVTRSSEHNSISPTLARCHRTIPAPDDHLYHTVQRLEASGAPPPRTPAHTTLLLGNKRDLEHLRCVPTDEGEALSLEFGCQFHEVSAAESLAGIHLAFQSLLREARSRMIIKGFPFKGRLSSPAEDTPTVSAVSRVLGNFLSRAGRGIRKKRPSHSI